MVNDRVNCMANVMVNCLKGFRHELRLLKFRMSALYLTILSFVPFVKVIAPRLAVCNTIANSFLMPYLTIYNNS